MVIEQKVKEVIMGWAAMAEQATVDLPLTTNVREDLDMDELELVEVTMELEEAYGIEIHDEELEKLLLIQDFVHLITTKTGETHIV